MLELDKVVRQSSVIAWGGGSAMPWLKTMYLAFFCSVLSTAAAAQEIPFRLVRNMLLLPVELNGVEVTARLDTGGAFSIIHPRTAERLALPTVGQVAAGGLGNRPVQYDLAAPSTLVIGSLSLNTKPLLMVGLNSMAPDADPPIGVTLGMDVVRDLVMEIDFDRSVIRFTPAAAFKDKPDGQRMAIRRVGDDRSIQTAITNWKIVRADFDTGNPGTIEMTESVALSALAGQPSSLRLAAGIDGTFVLRSSTLPTLTLAGVSFSDVPVSVRARPKDRIGLGMDILRRFNLVLDFSRDRMWMSPNSNVGLPYRKDRFGLWMHADTWPKKVLLVSPGSPAQRAGFKVGDLVAQLLDEAGAMVEHPDLLPEGAKLTVVLSDGERREIVASSYF